MKFLGHPVHAMVIHFPVALWSAHAVLHIFASHLPPGVSAVAGFWLLLVGTSVGWIAALLGAFDLIGVWRENNPARLRIGLTHALINGSVLLGFTCLFICEYSQYPSIAHGMGFISVEVALLAAMGIGNYFGASLVWGKS